MRRMMALLPIALAALCLGLATRADEPKEKTKVDFYLKADLVEGCTDKEFCPCHDPRGPKDHACRFMAAVRIHEGCVGDVDLKGVKFVVAGDLGRELGEVPLSTVVITYDSTSTEAQRRAMDKVIPRIWPMKWNRKVYVTTDIKWKANEDNSTEVSLGEYGSMRMKPRMDDDEFVTRKGLDYWKAKSNDGFDISKGVLRFKHELFDLSRNEAFGFQTIIEASGSVKETN